MKKLFVTLLFTGFISFIPSSLHLSITSDLSAQIPSDGLVGWYPFNGNANDESGNGNHGTVNGATLTTDRFGNANKAYVFDSGVLSSISLPIGQAIYNPMTVSVWVKAYRTVGIANQSDACINASAYGMYCGTNQNWVMHPAHGGQTQLGVGISMGTNTIQIAEHASFVLESRMTSQGSYLDYVHIAVVYTLDSSFLYLNGVEIVARSLACQNFPKFIGSGVLLGNEYCSPNFSGEIDDYGIWNRALPSSEVLQIFNDQTGQVQQPLTCNITAPTTTLCEGESVTLSVNTTGGSGASSQLPANLQQGLVAYYPFNGNANDESGNGNDGVVNGATLTADRYGVAGSAYSFDGSNDDIEVNHSSSLSFSNAVSISFWLYQMDYTMGNTLIGPERVPIGKVNSSGDGICFETVDNIGTCCGAQFYIRNGTSPIQFESVSPMPIASWVHIVGTYDGTNLRLYQNNILMGSFTGNVDLSSLIEDLFFGREGINNRFFKGYIDDVFIYNRALTPSEIQQLFNAQSYAWSTNETTPTITVTPSQNTTYSCTVSQGNQTCTASVDITVNPLLTWYADNDGDGFGNSGNALEACDQPQGFVSNANDCNDAEALAYTGAVDLCDNGIDEDCSGTDSTCIVLGCTDITACNFNPAANTDDASCTYPLQTYLTCDGTCINDTDGDGVCDEIEIAGCSDPTAFNYNPQATNDDGSCEAVLTCDVTAPVTEICEGESLVISQNNMPFQPVQLKSFQSDAVFSYGFIEPDFNATSWQNNFSYDFWVNPVSPIGAFPSPLQSCGYTSTYNIPNTSQKWVLFPVNSGNDLGLGVSVGTNGVFIGTHAQYHLASRLSYPTSLQGWNHIAVSVENKNVSLFINGNLVANTVNTATCNLKPNFSVGVDLVPQSGYGTSFSGKFSNVRIWNAPLTSAEVSWIKDKELTVGESNAKSFYRVDLENLIGTGSSNLNITTYGAPILENFALNGGQYIWNGTIGNSTLGIGNTGSIQVLWSEGSSTQSITVSPTQTTTYTATVTTATQTCTDSITITVNPLLMWYADADADGFGNPDDVVQDCNQPVGYTSDNTDCNDDDAATYPGAAEICDNNRDENCDGVDSLCFVAILGCTDINACNFNPEANTDDNSCILPQPEICNGLDDNCNGQVDEGFSVESLNVVPVTTAIFPVCVGNAVKSANLNTGANSGVIAGEGNDLWFSFTAQYNAVRVGLSAATGDNEIQLFQLNNGCLQWLQTEHETYTSSTLATGNQTLITDELIAGNTYYVAIHHISGPINASAKVCFNHFVASTCDHYYSNNTGIYPSVCSSFKAQYQANAIAYRFEVLSATQNNINQNITPWSYTTTSSSSVISRLGNILPANMGASAIQYTMQVPVLYSIPDAAGNLTNIEASATQTCQVVLSSQPTIVFRLTDRCPNNK